MAFALLLTDNQSAVMGEMLEQLGHKVETAENIKIAVDIISRNRIEIVIIEQEGQTALKSLSTIKGLPGLVIPIVVHNSTGNEIESIKMGAIDHIQKPDLKQLKQTIERSLATMDSAYQQSNEILVGQSETMRQIKKLVGMAASCEATVLVSGATGTGKDTVAREIHKHSKHNGVLAVVDCTAVPEDYEAFQSLSQDARGTVILDEIGDLNSKTQALLVRALKETTGVRIIATTQYDLMAMIKEKRFRDDLYYRLNVLAIQLPPLYERSEDILPLAEHFLHAAEEKSPKKLSRGAADALLQYQWPGNVRELQNLMYHLTFTVRSEIIESSDLPLEIQSQIDATANLASTTNLKNTNNSNNTNKLDSSDKTAEKSTVDSSNLDYYNAMADVEKQLLIKALESANGSRAEAARILGINRQLLYTKLKSHGLMNQ